LTSISAFGVVLAAIYMLWAYQRMFTGPITNEENRELVDLKTREIVSVVPLILLMIFIGVYPSFIEAYVVNDAEVIVNVLKGFK